MTKHYPTEVATTLWRRFPPTDRSALPLWELMFSMPETLEELLKRLSLLLQDKQEKDCDALPEDSCILLLAMLAFEDCDNEDIVAKYNIWRILKHSNPVMLSLVLRALLTLLDRAKMARKMLGLLPYVMEVINDGNSDIVLKALQAIFRVMGYLKNEVRPLAVQLTEKLLPVFNHESWKVREISIILFRDQMKSVVCRNKKQMKNYVRMALLPLFFHLNDETERVAKASEEALLAAAEFLRWAQLKHLIQTQQTWAIAECLLAEHRSKAEEYLDQSVPYLKDAQKDLRLAAMRFIGLAAQHLRSQSPEKTSRICCVLEPMTEDSDIAVRSLATQTIVIVSHPRQQSRAWRILEALCFWGL
ncbi:maestro heat-like repeat-containing protein family member 7 [Cuculus canorus]|uniref:maestro heat-like repeat-containing protein family member 7 n=1 Tax=Cuculus canorus TaxID=55661 RepID=UPI0023AA9599|nr:maestro heat-like repeat-containing protein family member 7 [Cuculus canorus]XP_053907654.1 maestro heat-like repeat-containing protein family member 7 [Cuculus canorus]